MEQRATIFLQVEAVNLQQHVFDTHQLSVIRGSSLLLKRAIVAVAERFAAQLESLSIGASVGLFRYRGGDDENPLTAAHALCAEIAGYLSTSPPPPVTFASTGQPPDFSACTFAVVCCSAPTLPVAKARLSALVRFRQLRQSTIAPDRSEGLAAAPTGRPCATSGRRRAVPGECSHPFRTADTADTWVSRSVARRLDVGRHARTGLYFDTDPDCAALLDGSAVPAPVLGFTNDFETLAVNPAFGNLDRKLAVLSFDGNGFGKRQGDYATNPERQREFDVALRCLRDRLLRQLVAALASGRHDQGTLTGATLEDSASPCLRLETLLWGGDEMTFVVPAWLGFDVLHLVFALWRALVDRRPAGDAGALQTLAGSTHAAGLVFCHYKTPIAEARRQAQRLVDRVKAAGTGSTDRHDAFDYLVLESIDYPTEPDLDQFFATRYGSVAQHRAPLTPDPDWWTDGQERVRSLASDRGLSRGGVFRLARALASDERVLDGLDDPGTALPPWARQADDPARVPKGLAELEVRAWRAMARAGSRVSDPAGSGTTAQDLEAFAAAVCINVREPLQRAWLWLHLAELWDYLSPVPRLSDAPERP